VGEDFEKRVLSSKKDSLILIEHPLKEKNRGIVEEFELFASVNKFDNVTLGRYNGINECEKFKCP